MDDIEVWFDFTPREFLRLEEICKTAKVKKRADVMRAALNWYSSHVEKIKDGWTRQYKVAEGVVEIEEGKVVKVSFGELSKDAITRVSFKLSPELYQKLEDICEAEKRADRDEVVKNALHWYWLHLEHMERGWTLQYKKGDEVVEPDWGLNL